MGADCTSAAERLDFAGHGVRLAARAFGPAAGPIVGLPAAGQTRHCWRPTALAIARDPAADDD